MCACGGNCNCEPLVLPNGIDGNPGINGNNGENGSSAVNATLGGFNQPAADTVVTVEVENSDLYSENMWVFITGGGYYAIDAIGSSTLDLIYNEQVEDFNQAIKAIGQPISTDALVIPAGFPGPQGLQGEQGPAGNTGNTGSTGASGDTGNSGNNGWTSIIVPVKHDGSAELATGLKVALKIIGYTGGTGSEPALPSNPYITASGYGVLANAIDISGSVWLYGSGAPSGGSGKVGDFYLDTASPNTVYVKTAVSTWSSITTLRGATGSTGATGATGPTGSTGADGNMITRVTAAGSSPFSTTIDDTDGNNGDFVHVTETDNLYYKTGGNWVKSNVNTWRQLTLTTSNTFFGTYSDSGAVTLITLDSLSGTILYKIVNDIFYFILNIDLEITNGEAGTRKVFVGFEIPQLYLTNTTSLPVTSRIVFSSMNKSFPINVADLTADDTITPLSNTFGAQRAGLLGVIDSAEVYETSKSIFLPIGAITTLTTVERRITGEGFLPVIES